jgi:hypothetical protein
MVIGTTLIPGISRVLRENNRMPTKTIACPDCGLVLHVSDDNAPGFKFVYDERDWRRRCMRLHLGDAAWCLVQRDGASPPKKDS